MRFLIRIILNAGALLLMAKYVPGIEFSGSWTTLLIAGVVLGILNGILR
ncbi:MAG: hypothetical protein COU85_00415 [Candidatus Portnoybacteria bacterium CG10_big_fil_rev_8_21_14_0_10_44_7]|uniref:Phage holin family protein n=1 Tax=Candidatus Portnoybacteria bacterium CG10_big_fil_rev_8_21_14_0_10_44_7 TaxID=1974816 RepID=A0A2M8KJE8_9BACT|nr:MAG: hypothetical protein COU85_00415 [Candidatus Portnoybacteria bacterium CG10_big_fil_rev_8_21_14_0_10_44_7]